MLPMCAMKVPSGAYLEIRELGPFLTWPSGMKIVPSRAVTTSVGSRSRPGPSPATPGSPMVISSSPSGVNLRTTWPPGASPRPTSAVHTLPS